MASPNTKGLTFTLIVFVIMTLGSGTAAIMFYQDNQEGLAQQREDKANAETRQREATRLAQEVQTLKALLGYEGFEIVGSPDGEAQDDSVYWAVKSDLEKNAGELQQKTVSATLEKMHAEMQELLALLSDKEKAYDDLQQQYAALDKTQQNLRDEVIASRDQANKNLQSVTENKEDELARKDEIIEETRSDLNAANGRAQELARELASRIAEFEERSRSQKMIIRHHAKELAEMKKDVFENEDGKIVFVSPTKSHVWINLGSSDFLPRHMSFSVYKKHHSGITRGENEIKGAIEVTRIIDSNMAEARILNNDLYNPIASGDPIYSPIWSPGRTEKVAIVGFIDWDDDDVSDRQKLRDIINSTGAKVVTEILDDGSTVPEDADFTKLITSDVKFLIEGRLPDPGDSNVESEQRRIQDVLTNYKLIQDSALDNGVRILSLSEFLDYIGHKNEHRLFKPGDRGRFKLKSGSRSASVGEDTRGLRDISSGDRNAGIYSRRPGLRRETSSGQTSKFFKQGGSRK